MKRYSQRTIDLAQDDTTSLAGWLYTDLLLALTIVFLATISFIPSQLEHSSSSGSSTKLNSSSSTNSQPDGSLIFSTLLNKQSPLNLKSQLSQFLSNLNANGAVEVRSIQIEGGFNPRSESEYDGTLTAMDFFKKLKNENLALFQDANTTISTSKLVPSRSIYLRIFYGPASS